MRQRTGKVRVRSNPLQSIPGRGSRAALVAVLYLAHQEAIGKASGHLVRRDTARAALGQLQKQRTRNPALGNAAALEDYGVFLAEGEPLAEEEEEDGE